MSQESEDEIFCDDTLKEDIASCLDNIQCIGSFAIFEPLHSMPNPGLFVQDIGIGLPLSHIDAATIIAASHQAPFGRGTETVVDENIRNTRELSSNEFRLANPEWNKALGNILRKISDGLGLTASGKSMEAHPYKLLLYEEGAHFKPHQDSEKIPGMFGTLVIALPSQHQGGEVHLSHKSQKKVFETSKYSDFNYSYLAWFSDVIHEVKPILSGRRLVLTYNLVQTSPGTVETAANSTKDLDKLNSIFSWWQKHKSDEGVYLPKVMAHLFDHYYTEAGLCYDALKGKDLQVAAHLKEAAAQNDFHICLANFKRTIVGDCEDGYPQSNYWDEDDDEDDEEGKHHSIEYEHVRETSLVYIAELDGSSLIARNITFDEENIVQADPFEDVLPDNEEFEGHTGNAGAQATHHYNRTVALIMPRSHRIPYFLKYIKPDEWLDRLASDTANRPESAERNARDMIEICNLVVNKSKIWKSAAEALSSQPYSDRILARILKAAVDLDDKSLFLETYDLVSGKVPMDILTSVGVAVSRHDLLELLSPHLTSEFSRYDMCSDKYLAICKFNDGINTGLNSSYHHSAIPYQAGPVYNWIKSQCWECLNSTRVESAMDGMTMTSLCIMFPNNILDVILPKMKANTQSTQAMVAFLVNLFDLGELGRVPKDVATSVFTAMISELIEHFSVNRVGTNIVSNKRLKASDGSSQPVAEAPAEFGKRNLAQLLYCCLSLNLGSELQQLIEKLCEIAAKVDVRWLDTIFMSFLDDMIDVLRENQVTIPGSPFRGLFQRILDVYIRRFVRPEPRQTDWTMREKGCNRRYCNDCEKLDEFLCSSTQRVERFRVSKQARHHLHLRLNDGSCKHETDRRTNTLVVTKPAPSGSHEAWKKRYDHAVEKIKALKSDLLENLLEECYEFVVNLSAVKRIPVPIPNQQTPSTSQPTQPPPPPAWLKLSLEDLKAKFSEDSFEAVMKYATVDIDSGVVVPSPPSGEPAPPNAKWIYLPRIRCHDCPGKLYNPGLSTTADNFEVHLKNRAHRDRVSSRLVASEKLASATALSKTTISGGGNTAPPPKTVVTSSTNGATSTSGSSSTNKMHNVPALTVERKNSNCLAGMTFYFPSALLEQTQAQTCAMVERNGGKVGWPEKESTIIVLPIGTQPSSYKNWIKIGRRVIGENDLHALISDPSKRKQQIDKYGLHASAAKPQSSISTSSSAAALPPTIKNKNWDIGSPDCLAGLHFHFTGDLPTLNQAQRRAVIDKYGGKLGGRWRATDEIQNTTKTTFMVLAANAHPLNARNFNRNGHQVIDEDGLFALIIARSPTSTNDNNSIPSKIQPPKAKNWYIGSPSCLANMNFIITGDLATISLIQGILIIEKYGGKMDMSDKGSTIIVVKRKLGQEKEKQLRDMGYKDVIDEEAFYGIIAKSAVPLKEIWNGILPPMIKKRKMIEGDEMENIPIGDKAAKIPTRGSGGEAMIIDMTGDSD